MSLSRTLPRSLSGVITAASFPSTSTLILHRRLAPISSSSSSTSTRQLPPLSSFSTSSSLHQSKPSPSPSSSTSPSPPNPILSSTSNDPDAPPPLPILPRPLGQRDPPTTANKTWQEKKEELMDQDLRREKRKALVKEATQGYFHDFHQIRREGGHGGKTWIGPNVLIREDKALYFPNISGPTLLRSSPVTHTTDLFKDKITVVVVLSARISEEHAVSFLGDVLDDWEEGKVGGGGAGGAGGVGGKEGVFQYVQINHQPNPLKSLLLRLFISSLKRTMKESRWGGYMIAGGEWGGLKQPLGITNKHVGYVYLVDPAGKIRWAGCGFATPEEREALRRGVAVLLGRVKQKQQGGEGEGSVVK